MPLGGIEKLGLVTLDSGRCYGTVQVTWEPEFGALSIQPKIWKISKIGTSLHLHLQLVKSVQI